MTAADARAGAAAPRGAVAIRRTADPAASPAAKRPSTTRRLVVAGVAALLVVQAVVFLAVQGTLARLGVEATRTPWSMGVAVLAGAAVVATGARALGLRREAGRVAAALALAGVAVGALAVAAAAVGAAERAPWSMSVATLGVVVAILPAAVVDTVRGRRRRRMEERFPALLRDLDENHRAALTMPAALVMTGRGDHGALTPEVRRMAQQVEWGVPYQEAMRIFADRVATPAVRRTVELVVRATEAGGDVAKVLAAAARHARERRQLAEERRLSMVVYVLVVYVSFGVFLAVVAALQGVFVPAMLDATRGAGAGVGGIAFQAVDEATYRDLFYSAGFVQALGSGAMAGVIAEGRVAAGLKHVAALLLVAFVVLGVLL